MPLYRANGVPSRKKFFGAKTACFSMGKEKKRSRWAETVQQMIVQGEQ